MTTTWPKRLTSKRRRHSSIAKASTGTLTPMPALLTSASQCPALRIFVHPSGQRLDVVWVGDIDDQRLDPRRTDGVCVPVASNTREDVEPPARQFTSRGRADAGGCTRDDGHLLRFI